MRKIARTARAQLDKSEPYQLIGAESASRLCTASCLARFASAGQARPGPLSDLLSHGIGPAAAGRSACAQRRRFRLH